MSEATLNPPSLVQINKDLGATVAEEMSNNILLQAEIDALKKERDELRLALAASVKLQSHYAELLNGWDGGERLAFSDADAWIERLRVCKGIPAS